MGLFDKLLGRGAVTNMLNRAFFGITQHGGVAWLPEDAKTYVTHGYENATVYAAVRVLLNKQTEAPLLISKVIDEKSYARYKSFIRDADTPAARVATTRFRQKAFEDVSSGGYGTMYDLLKNPNDYQTTGDFWETFWLFYDLTGEAFIYAIRAGAGSKNQGKPIELHVLPSHAVTIVFSGNYKKPVKGYSFNVGDSEIFIEYDDVLHFKKPNPNWDTSGGQLRGFAPLKAGRKTLTKNNLNIEAQAVAMKNGGSVTLIHGDPSKGKMDPTQMDKMDELIKDKIKGAHNYKNIVMTNGYLDAKKIGDNIVDMDLLNAEKRDEQKICALFGVHPILIGSDVNSTENNVRAAYKSLVTNVVLSDLLKRDEKLTAWLVPMFGTNEIIRTDTTVYSELAPDLELMSKIFGQPRLTENEKRELFNYGKSDNKNMDLVFIPAGMQTVDQAATGGGFTNDDYV